MKKILHIFGIHDWKYQPPVREKITERIVNRIDVFNEIDTGKTWSGYAPFQARTCSVCNKYEYQRI